MRGGYEKHRIQLDKLPETSGALVAHPNETVSLKRPRIASASTALRRRWAVYETGWMALTILSLAFCVKGTERVLLSPVAVVYALGAVFLGLRVYWQGQRVRLFLRGRGRPTRRSLEREVSNVNALYILILIFLFLGAITIPKISDLNSYSEQGATRGNLGAIRSALSIYYGDKQGNYPSHLETLLIGGKYLSLLPQAKPGKWHEDSNHIVLGSEPTDVGGWLYNNNPTDPNWGTLVVNCTHTDSRGSVWTSY